MRWETQNTITSIFSGRKLLHQSVEDDFWITHVSPVYDTMYSNISKYIPKVFKYIQKVSKYIQMNPNVKTQKVSWCFCSTCADAWLCNKVRTELISLIEQYFEESWQYSFCGSIHKPGRESEWPVWNPEPGIWRIWGIVSVGSYAAGITNHWDILSRKESRISHV